MTREEVEAHMRKRYTSATTETPISQEELDLIFDATCDACESYILQELIGKCSWTLEEAEEFLMGRRKGENRIRYCLETVKTSILNLKLASRFDTLTRAGSNTSTPQYLSTLITTNGAKETCSFSSPHHLSRSSLPLFSPSSSTSSINSNILNNNTSSTHTPSQGGSSANHSPFPLLVPSTQALNPNSSGPQSASLSSLPPYSALPSRLSQGEGGFSGSEPNLPLYTPLPSSTHTGPLTSSAPVSKLQEEQRIKSGRVGPSAGEATLSPFSSSLAHSSAHHHEANYNTSAISSSVSSPHLNVGPPPQVPKKPTRKADSDVKARSSVSLLSTHSSSGQSKDLTDGRVMSVDGAKGSAGKICLKISSFGFCSPRDCSDIHLPTTTMCKHLTLNGVCNVRGCPFQHPNTATRQAILLPIANGSYRRLVQESATSGPQGATLVQSGTKPLQRPLSLAEWNTLKLTMVFHCNIPMRDKKCSTSQTCTVMNCPKQHKKMGPSAPIVSASPSNNPPSIVQIPTHPSLNALDHANGGQRGSLGQKDHPPALSTIHHSLKSDQIASIPKSQSYPHVKSNAGNKGIGNGMSDSSFPSFTSSSASSSSQSITLATNTASSSSSSSMTTTKHMSYALEGLHTTSDASIAPPLPVRSKFELKNVTGQANHMNLVTSIMQGGCGKKGKPLKILKLIEICNPQLDAQYKAFFESTQTKKGMRPSEIYAFHGAPEGAISSIAKNGFDMTKIKRTKFGHGLYCALDANISVDYCANDHQMLLVRLITDGLKWVKDPAYYVVHDSASMNPLYIITFDPR